MRQYQINFEVTTRKMEDGFKPKTSVFARKVSLLDDVEQYDIFFAASVAIEVKDIKTGKTIATYRR